MGMDQVYFHIESIRVMGDPKKITPKDIEKYGPNWEGDVDCANGALIKENRRGDVEDFDPETGKLRHDLLNKDPRCVTDLLLTVKSQDVSSVRIAPILRTLPVDFAGMGWPYPVSAYSSDWCGIGGEFATACQYIVKNEPRVRLAYPTALTKMFPEWAECEFQLWGKVLSSHKTEIMSNKTQNRNG